MYTTKSIEDVNAADIVTTISRYLPDLKKQGANFVAKSPFTQEKTGSFVVSPAKQMFKDFSSGKGGNGVKFVMEMDKCEWIEAIVKVASIHNIHLDKEHIPEEQARIVKEKTSLLSITTRAAVRYVSNYNDLPDTHWAKEMIAKRGFSQDTIIDFQIGFALNENQITTAVSSNGRLTQSIELGITSQGTGNSYDFFRNRIMFPILNTQGMVVGFGGRRSNAPDDEKYSKYINSKESKLYDKQSVLYGLHQAKTEIRKLGYVILTEGYTDVIGMHDKGACNAVATCGTALTETHCKELKKYCEHVLLLRDGDPAGIKASIRDINILLPFGFQVSIYPLTDNIDPDDLARIHGENVQNHISQNRIDGLVWLAERIADDFVSSNYKLNLSKVEKDLEINLQSIESNRILLDGLEEPDLKKANVHNNKLNKEADAFRKEAEKSIKDFSMIDPYAKQRGMTELYQTLSLVKSEIALKETLRNISKIVDIPIKEMDKEVANVILERKEKEKKAKENNKPIKPNGFPDGASLEQYFEDRFAIVGNEYYFDKGENFFSGTNFSIIPLYHIKGRKENKRLCEVKNVDNKTDIIDFDSESLVSYADFRKHLIRTGNYRFRSGTNTAHFDLVVEKISNNFNLANELQSLGWNQKGFFAFANGIYWQKQFINVNNYGICYLEGIAKNDEEDDYNEKVEYYYSPAFSVIHKRNQEGDDPYENDRKFVFKKADITLNQWMRQMLTVFQEKAMIGIVFNFASLYRDVFLKNYDFFPLLGGFGEKDSGKSGFGKIIQNFFFYQDEPLELNQATLVGLNRRLSRTTNTVTFLDEYNNQLDEKILQAPQRSVEWSWS